jgi:hypothetical protein
MVVVPLASVFDVLFPIPTVFVPLYVVPLTVTLQFFEAVELIAPYAPEINSSFHETVEVLLSIDWLAISQLNFNVS